MQRISGVVPQRCLPALRGRLTRGFGDFERIPIENVDLLSVDFQRRAPARPE